MKKAVYKGWEVYSLQNEWIRLLIAPQLGGRIIQLNFKGYEFFFVNPAFEGQRSESDQNAGDVWKNFGGEKIWPAPQGWDSPSFWPGPPDPILDGGNYDIFALREHGISLRSPVDDFTGLQLHREVLIDSERAEINIRVRFENKSSISRCWAIWPVAQMNILPGQKDDTYQVVIPLNADSVFQNRYNVMHGLVNNPQNQPEGNRLIINYKYLIGKTGLDTNGGWVAFCDKINGKVFVMSFEYQEGKIYPDNTTVQVWTQGRGTIYSRNEIRQLPDDQELNPPYTEIELLSPLENIAPGESISFTYRMKVCTIPAGESVISVLGTTVIASPLKIQSTGGRLMISGKYGFFSAGMLKVRYEKQHNGETHKCCQEKVLEASPLYGLEIDTDFLCPEPFKGKVYIEFENNMDKSVELIESLEV